MGSDDPDLDDDSYGSALCPDCGEWSADCVCDDDPDDCMGCGQCWWCIERSITAAEEGERSEG